jgi:hypothetical protein
MTNEERAQRAEAALAAYQGRDAGETLADNIVDLVVDLMHLAHQNDILPGHVAKVSGNFFAEEVEAEAGKPGNCMETCALL